VGSIFTDKHITDYDKRLTGNVFMILLLMKNRERKKVIKNLGRHGMVYEYLDSRGHAPGSINGLPMFFSMRWLNGHDTKIVFRKADKMREAMKEMK
jgi:hypothetical protein